MRRERGIIHDPTASTAIARVAKEKTHEKRAKRKKVPKKISGNIFDDMPTVLEGTDVARGYDSERPRVEFRFGKEIPGRIRAFPDSTEENTFYVEYWREATPARSDGHAAIDTARVINANKKQGIVHLKNERGVALDIYRTGRVVFEAGKAKSGSVTVEK